MTEEQAEAQFDFFITLAQLAKLNREDWTTVLFNAATLIATVSREYEKSEGAGEKLKDQLDRCWPLVAGGLCAALRRVAQDGEK